MLRINQTSFVNSMSSHNQPCIHAKSGDRIVFETIDALGGKACEYFENKIDHSEYEHLANPSTGPVFVDGAEPGDTLIVTIEKIDLKKEGFIYRRGSIFGKYGNDQSDCVVVQARGNQLIYNNHSIPAEPMIGVIGTAPLSPVHCKWPGDHGGNIDTRLVRVGANVFLPVFVEGAFLAIGDIHACMGDGEVSGQGIEFGAEVTVSILVDKHQTIRRPRIENEEKIVFIASDSTINKAKEIVLEDVGSYLMNKIGLSFEDAFGLAIFYGHLKVSQIVNPLLTIRYEIKKSALNQFRQNNS